MTTRTRFTALVILLLAAGAAVAAAAEPAPTPGKAPDVAPAAPAGVPATAPAAPEHPIALRDDAANTMTLHADGSRSAVLDASFLSTSVARFDAEGRLVIGCVGSREEYDAFFAAEALPDGAEVR